ncbi:MAG: hypothetical protein WCK27_21860 [Verrucomicrobiota bacterium]
MAGRAQNKLEAAAGLVALRRWLAFCVALTALAGLSRAAVVSVLDSGAGNDYMSGAPITLPAAALSTNLFRDSAQVIRNRLHTARPVTFDSTGRLEFLTNRLAKRTADGGTNLPGNDARPAPLAAPAGDGPDPADGASTGNGFPAYLEGQQYVWFLQDVRHYTNYSCTVTVDCPSTFYLLVDNRVNDYLIESPYDDPAFGPPDTQWVLKDGWKRVNTGLTPVVNPTHAGDYVGIDEGNTGTIRQVYAVYARTLSKPGSITLGTEFDGNIYCLVVSTNAAPLAKATKPAAPKESASR